MAAVVDIFAVVRARFARPAWAASRIEAFANLQLGFDGLWLTLSGIVADPRYITAGGWDVAAGCPTDLGIACQKLCNCLHSRKDEHGVLFEIFTPPCFHLWAR